MTLEEQLNDAIETASKRMKEYAQMRKALCMADAMLQLFVRDLDSRTANHPDGLYQCLSHVRRAIDATS